MCWFCMFLTILILVFSSQTMAAAQQAAMVFMRSVMPALFPMMIIGGLITHYSPVVRTRTRVYIFQIIFGFCTGSPASTRQLAAVAEHHHIQDYRNLLCMSGVMSPMFFTGALASYMGKTTALMILLCHWVAAILTGLLYARTAHGKRRDTFPQMKTKQAHSPVLTQSSFTALPAIIRDTALAQLSILGTMITFSILASVFRELLLLLFPVWTANHSSWLNVGWALMEIGGGTMALLDGNPSVNPWLICGLCSFGGLSIWQQNLLFLNPKVHPAELLCFRILHGVIAMILSFFVFRWLPAQPALSQVFAVRAQITSAAASTTSMLALLLLIALAVPSRWPLA